MPQKIDKERKQASCDGKQSLTEAIATRISKRSTHKLMPYHCDYCGGWHVGSTTGKMKDERKQSKHKGDR